MINFLSYFGSSLPFLIVSRLLESVAILIKKQERNCDCVRKKYSQWVGWGYLQSRRRRQLLETWIKCNRNRMACNCKGCVEILKNLVRFCLYLSFWFWTNNNLLLTEREGRTGEYWPEVVAVRTERSEVRTKTTEGQYSPVRFEQARLVSSLLYGTRSKLVYL